MRRRGIVLHVIGRRDVLRAWAASLVAPVACGRAARPEVRDGRVVVTFWYAYGDLVRKVLLDLVARYNASQSRVLVEAVHQGDYFECLAKLRTAIAAGAAPDALARRLRGRPVPRARRSPRGARRLRGRARFAFVPALAQGGTFDGGDGEPLVAIPFNRSTPIAFPNARMLAEARVAPPRTWDELVDVARALTRRAERRRRCAGASRCPISWWYWVAMVGQAGGRLVEPDGRMSLGGEAGERAVRFWQRLVHDERVDAAAARTRLPGLAVARTRASCRAASR